MFNDRVVVMIIPVFRVEISDNVVVLNSRVFSYTVIIIRPTRKCVVNFVLSALGFFVFPK